MKNELRIPGQTDGVRSVDMRVGDNGVLHVRLGMSAPIDHLPKVAVGCDGIHVATVPTFAVPGEPSFLALSCSLPAAGGPAQHVVELRNGAEGGLIDRQLVDIPSPLVNPLGLLAFNVVAKPIFPMFSAPWISFDGAELIISGAHLPPGGDPGKLSVQFGAGVAGSFEYSLPSPEFGAHYWSWPNAHLSGFRVHINLPESAPGTDPFTFRFDYGLSPAPPESNGGPWEDRSRIWIPKNLLSFIGFPQGDTQLTRVQTWSEHKTVTFTGYNAFRGFESLLSRYGVVNRPGIRLLDWGCGHGRVTRHFIENWQGAQISGTDIDAENIAWCSRNLAGGNFILAPLWPPLAIKSSSVDAIIGLSVMTHLTAEAQDAWINELRRILRPGGVALITFGGDGAAAFASLHHPPEWWEQWIETGFNDGLLDPALQGKIADATYYRVTHQTGAQVRKSWSRALTVVDIVPQAFGYQDVAVLRRN